MSKKVAGDIVMGLKNAVNYMEGKRVGSRKTAVKVPKKINVSSIRNKMKLSQEKFARQFGFALATLRDWEQGRRQPERAARILLKIIDHDPNIVAEALS